MVNWTLRNTNIIAIWNKVQYKPFKIQLNTCLNQSGLYYAHILPFAKMSDILVHASGVKSKHDFVIVQGFLKTTIRDHVFQGIDKP